MTIRFPAGKIGKMQLSFIEIGATSGEQELGIEVASVRT